MANLYDLELQESNNFIHLLMQNGEAASLKLLRDQKNMSAMLGPAGAEIVKALEDPTSEIGASFKRLSELEVDAKTVMAAVGMEASLADAANNIFKTSPQSLEGLDDKSRGTLNDYWIKKKEIIAKLTDKGYSYQELFS